MRDDDLVIPPRPPLPAGVTQAVPKPAPRIVRIIRRPGRILAVYGAVLTLIAFWPSPVDAGARPLLIAITRLFPALTYPRIEFAGNVALFIPLGLLLALLLRRERWLVLPIAFLTTVFIECGQAVALADRTPSLLDIVANTAGACIGMLITAFGELLARSRTSAA